MEMSRIMTGLLLRLNELLRAEEGQDLVEYGLVALFVILVCIGSISPIATEVNSAFSKVSTSIS